MIKEKIDNEKIARKQSVMNEKVQVDGGYAENLLDALDGCNVEEV